MRKALTSHYPDKQFRIFCYCIFAEITDPIRSFYVSIKRKKRTMHLNVTIIIKNLCTYNINMIIYIKFMLSNMI